jgi:hypothetical protein
MLERMLEMDNSIQIIHYVRDPRGIALSISLMYFWKRVTDNITEWATKQCYNMHQDQLNIRQLIQTTNILQLRYEDLAINFNSSIHKIYYFIKQIIPSDVMKWFDTNTNCTVDNGDMGTTRVNSTITAYKWHVALPPERRIIIDRVCREVFIDYDYHL